MRKIVKPPRLERGDTIGIVSPAAAFFPVLEQSFRRGVVCLEQLGLRVRVAGHALRQHEYINPPPQLRAQDINAMFEDPEIKAIFCLSGGSGVNAVLPLLDWPAIDASPKIVMGYSAITALLIGLYTKTGLVTFHGPMLLYEFGEYPELFDYTRRQVEQILFKAESPERLSPPAQWTDAYPRDDGPRPMKPNPGWRWLKSGTARGPLIGGNLRTLLTLVGTSYWPSFQDAILCIEEVKMGPGVLRDLDASLAQCQQIGLFDQISGLVVGKINELSEEEEELFEVLVREYTACVCGPILMGVDFGHTDPRLVLPIGIQASLNSEQDRFCLEETAVEYGR